MTTPQHTEDSTPFEDPNTGPRKALAKNTENVMFYHRGGGGSALQGLKKITIYMRTQESSEV